MIVYSLNHYGLQIKEIVLIKVSTLYYYSIVFKHKISESERFGGKRDWDTVYRFFFR